MLVYVLRQLGRNLVFICHALSEYQRRSNLIPMHRIRLRLITSNRVEWKVVALVLEDMNYI